MRYCVSPENDHCQNALTVTCIRNILLVQYLLITIQNCFAQSEEKHCTFYCSDPFKSSSCNKQYRLSFFKVKDAQYSQFAAWKTTATAVTLNSGTGVCMTEESHSLKVSQVWHVSTIIALLKANTFGKAELARYIFYLYSKKYIIIASEIACLTITGPNKYELFQLEYSG